MDEDYVFISLGGNLPSPEIGSPLAVMAMALRRLPSMGIVVRRRSRWYRSAPLPASDQPLFTNGVLQVETALSPRALLQALHRLEADFGRVRRAPNEARVLDLDLLAFSRIVIQDPNGLRLPHPRMHLRAFVLEPLAELAPRWIHPRLGLTAREMLAALPDEQWVEPIEEERDGRAARSP